MSKHDRNLNIRLAANSVAYILLILLSLLRDFPVEVYFWLWLLTAIGCDLISDVYNKYIKYLKSLLNIV